MALPGELRLTVAVLFLTAPLIAQRGGSAAPHFDVASIKPAAVSEEWLARTRTLGGCPLVSIDRVAGRVSISATTTCGLIRLAYDVADYQVFGVPADLATPGARNAFQIDGRTGDDMTPTVEEARVLLRSLLADRFQLRVHREPRLMKVYALVVAKGGPTWTPCGDPRAGSVYSPGRLINCAPVMPWARITQMLSREIGVAVVDRTGLAPAPFELHWLPESATTQSNSPPGLFTAIQEQLGLKLEPRQARIDSIIVDRAVRPSAN